MGNVLVVKFNGAQFVKLILGLGVNWTSVKGAGATLAINGKLINSLLFAGSDVVKVISIGPWTAQLLKDKQWHQVHFGG